ncbi:MAG: tetratricopeptide repeat protein [Desulfobulbaceae bacterium]|nr:tetratricopeptide repeat protein [Desulfobulbaceae bacterium]
MLHYLFTICLCLFLAGPEAHAAERTRLLNMGQGDAVEETIIRLGFSKRPRYRLDVSGQRIDLFLYDTAIGSAFAAAPQQGGSVSSITLTEKMTGLMVSFHMAGVPRGASVVLAGAHGMDLEIHVLWDSAVGKVQPKVGSRLVGGSGSGDNTISARITPKSQYSANWERFYRDYETPIVWQLPVRYTFPDLPDLGSCSSVVLREIWRRSQAGAWEDVASLLKRLGGDKLVGDHRQVFLLLSGASLLQAGQYEPARKLYAQFRQEFPQSPYLKRFTVMAASGLAHLGNPYGAVTEITPLLSKNDAFGKRGEPAAELLYAEVLLATGRPEKALSALAVAGGEGVRLRRMVLLRTADARAALGQYREALLGYHQWLVQDGKEGMDLYSQARWVEALEKQGDIKAAAPAYSRLAETPQSPEGRALAMFAAARAVRKLGQVPVALERCVTIRRRLPGSEGAFRAWLLELDIIMLGGDKVMSLQRSGEYATIAATAPARVLREEAAFKYALAVLLAGDNGKGVELLQAFRRDFASGQLRGEAEILLLQKLEPLVAGLLQAGKSYEAMVLIERNRDLLSTFTLPPVFAVQVAQVFREMGMYPRAAGIYLYLISHSDKKAEEETYYLPLAEVLYAQGFQEDLLTAVARYRVRFPAGKSLAALLTLQGRLCLEAGRLDEAATLLKSCKEESPAVLELRNRLALALTLRDGVGGNALTGVLPGKPSEVEEPAARLLRAERLLREGKAEQALEVFQQLIAADAFADQSRYRCGQIYLDRGDRKQGINFLRDLVDKGKEKYWQGLAREMLALASVG